MCDFYLNATLTRCGSPTVRISPVEKAEGSIGPDGRQRTKALGNGTIVCALRVNQKGIDNISRVKQERTGKKKYRTRGGVHSLIVAAPR